MSTENTDNNEGFKDPFAFLFAKEETKASSEVIPYIQGASDTAETPPLEGSQQAVSATVAAPQRRLVPEYILGLSIKERNNIAVLSRDLYLEGNEIEPKAVFKSWPVLDNCDDKIRLIKAGKRPTLSDISAYMGHEEFQRRLVDVGVITGTTLTTRQRLLLSSLANFDDRKNLSQRLKSNGVSQLEFQGWLRMPEFKKRWDQIANESLKDAITAAKTVIAQKMVDGDFNFIKYGMEITGEYNPNDRKQVDAAKLVQVIFDVLEEEVKDPEILKRIGAKIQLRGNMGRPELSD